MDHLSLNTLTPETDKVGREYGAHMKNRIYVENLPHSVNETSLTELFSQGGKVESVNIIKDRSTGKPLGHAFVEMASDFEANSAIDKLNGVPLEGIKLLVTLASPVTQNKGFSGNPNPRERKRRS